MSSLIRDHLGQLESFAWPGGYSILYILADGALLCADCANGENDSCASPESDDPQWRIVGSLVHWEEPPEQCAHCNAELESEYGDPEASDE